MEKLYKLREDKIGYLKGKLDDETTKEKSLHKRIIKGRNEKDFAEM